ncbi:type 1 glutamine amidotransferase domain-containing protein [Larkinella punicea]|uniref:Type 1 glutamine amidotransferase domain-containing protein n=1 Tax=Larkinella punicea TaxID=2315727 RepID=A0A368JRU9_9BACT|nr:type 1 glutamine amidotransferase domain-containing protein [Larkinella punicea]
MRALIVCTNHTDYKTKLEKTGLWLSELTHFYDELSDKEIPYDIVSPKGGRVPIDARSLKRKDNTNDKWYHNPVMKAKLENALKPEEVNAAHYQLIYFTGGHGTLWDFPENDLLQQITRQIYEGGGMVAAVCHGVSGLLNVRLSDGSLLIQDRQITGFANVEERLLGLIHEVPFLLEDELRKRNTLYRKSLIPFLPFIEVDDRLVTGQNPLSARKVGKKVMEEMVEK